MLFDAHNDSDGYEKTLLSTLFFSTRTKKERMMKNKKTIHKTLEACSSREAKNNRQQRTKPPGFTLFCSIDSVAGIDGNPKNTTPPVESGEGISLF